MDLFTSVLSCHSTLYTIVSDICPLKKLSKDQYIQVNIVNYKFSKYMYVS